MSGELLKIIGATVYDPANGVDGEVRDLWISDGKFVAPPTECPAQPSRTIDARGLVAMPGGIDVHCHIAGTKPNAGRLLTPDLKRPPAVVARTPLTRSGTLGPVPSTFVTGYKYAGMGYTTAFEAAMAPLGSRHAHLELADTPCLDKGAFVLVGNNHYALQCIERGDGAQLRTFLAWLLTTSRAYAPKLVNPGGVVAWKQTPASSGFGLDEPIPGFRITARDVVRELVAAANDLQLPHPAHIHCNQLGLPGNWRTTLETMRAVGDLRAHFTHIQFHSYGGGDEGTMSSRVAELADYVNAHPNLTVDVGQVMFGPTLAMTGDGAAAYYLHRLYGDRWYNCDIEWESGCGVTPIAYRRKNVVHALQWAIGLEWLLLVRNPWQVMLSTDHPNGGSFVTYPQIIRLLTDCEHRRELLAQCPAAMQERTRLREIDREYTLGEIAIVTRAAAARALGLSRKGTLAAGADADLVLYNPDSDREKMFALPRQVMKGGSLVVDEGELRSVPDGDTIVATPEFDPDRLPAIKAWFERHYSLQWSHYGV